MKASDFYKLFTKFITQTKIDLYLASNSDSFKFLIQANNRGQNWSIVFLKYMMGGFFISNFSMSALSLAVCWGMTKTLDQKLLNHPFQIM